MEAKFNLFLKFGEETISLSPYLAKFSVSFAKNLCSTAWKSVIDTASLILVFNDRNQTELQSLFARIVSAQQSFPAGKVGLIIKQNALVVFKGDLDLGKLSIESSKLPGSISLSAKSRMAELDVKPTKNFVIYPGTVKAVVNRCLSEAGLPNVSSWDSIIETKELETPFVVTDEDKETYQKKIDTLLQEMGGYVLVYNAEDDDFKVAKINDPAIAFPSKPINYLVSSKLKSSTTKFAKDGVVVKYKNVKQSSDDQSVYIHNISLKTEDDVTIGEEVASGAYFPEDSDINKTYEEYDSSWLDYGTLTKTERKQNDHMGIYFVDPETVTTDIIASNMTGGQVPSSWYSNDAFYSPEGGFNYPAGGAYYPTKAWLALKNTSGQSINVTHFEIKGRTYYSDTDYRVVMPLSCKDPEEYESAYISKASTAKEYALFLMNIQRFSGDTSTWTERWEEHKLGDKVKIVHKSGSTINAVVVSKKTVLYGVELWAEVTAVSLDGWSLSQDALIESSANGLSANRKDGAKGEDGYSYTILINSSNGNVFRLPNVSTTLSCVVLKNNEDITDTLDDSKFCWKRISGDTTLDEQWNTSSKALYHKTVDITGEDCIGRTVFECEVDL